MPDYFSKEGRLEVEAVITILPKGTVKITNTRTGASISSDEHDFQVSTQLANYYFPPMASAPLYVKPGDPIKIEMWMKNKNTNLPIANLYCEADSGDAWGAWGSPIPHPWPMLGDGMGKYTDANGYVSFDATIPSNLEAARRFTVYTWCRIEV